jgi:hypothetical protein
MDNSVFLPHLGLVPLTALEGAVRVREMTHIPTARQVATQLVMAYGAFVTVLFGRRRPHDDRVCRILGENQDEGRFFLVRGLTPDLGRCALDSKSTEVS